MPDPIKLHPAAVSLAFCERTLSTKLPNLLARVAYRSILARDADAFASAIDAAQRAAAALDAVAEDLAIALLAMQGEPLPENASPLALACSQIRNDSTLEGELSLALAIAREDADAAWQRIAAAQKIHASASTRPEAARARAEFSRALTAEIRGLIAKEGAA